MCVSAQSDMQIDVHKIGTRRHTKHALCASLTNTTQIEVDDIDMGMVTCLSPCTFT